jgi:peptidoglycan/xylan/chitin deacetylase (PgdA/CDA1 family)
LKTLILCYHKVGPEKEQGRRLNVSKERLAAHVRYFSRRHHRFLRASELAQPWPAKGICFTFDDAYQCAIEHGLLVFASRSLPATFYPVSSLVGKTSEWDGPLARPLAGWDMLREVEAAGSEIGNHSVSHPKMAQIGPEQQMLEVCSAHEALTDAGLSPKTFCYPYGSINEDARVAAKACGYEVGLALGKKVATTEDPLIALPRIVVAYSDALPKLLYKIHVRPKLPK